MRPGSDLPVRRVLHLERVRLRRDRNSHTGIRYRHLPHGRLHPRPGWRPEYHQFPAGPDRVRVLPDLSGHRHPSGTVHVPGVLAGARPDL